MSAIRIVVVDDSALFRALLRNAITDLPGCEVVASVADGKSALQKIDELKPDLVTLDVEMPEMNGIAVLQELKRRRSTSKVLMVSRFTATGAQVTTDALLQGAFDFILKPSAKDPAANKAELSAALADKIAAVRDALAGPAETALAPPQVPARSKPAAGCEAVVIGCSTGGPDALGQVLPQLKPDLEVPVFVIQHMPENFTASLATRLNEACELEVAEATDGSQVGRGKIVLARGGRHLLLKRRGPKRFVVHVTDDPPEHSCRPSVDYALRSAVDALGSRVLAVILTGMGRDGLEGCRLVRSRGGRVIAQHADGCTVFGMPKVVIASGQADQIIRLPEIPRAIEMALQEMSRSLGE
jgi:two-component system chemotaxis response regulator CheB